MISPATPEAETTPENTTDLTTEVAEAEENVIVYILHENDRPLFYELAPHIDNLTLRFGNLFSWKGYEFPTYKTDKTQYGKFVKHLERSFLFLPFTSPVFLTSFWRMLENNNGLKQLLESTYVQPIPLHAVHGVAQTLLPQPLSAYEGYQREEACTQIIAFIEAKMLAHLGQSQNKPTLLPMLAETSKHF